MGTRTKIVIDPTSVCFNRTRLEIKDSSSMSYVFQNEAKRILSLRHAGTQAHTHLPIWEFSVEWPDDDMIVMSREIIGYGEFWHERNQLLQIHTDVITESVPKTLAA